MKKLLFSLPLLLLSLTSSAITLPRLFQSGMVLQRQQPLPVWGTANGGETVTVTFRGKTYTTTADADGKWRLTLPKQKPGGPFTMQIGDVTLTDVMVGDVWMVSGQSNIDTNIERVYPQYAADIDAYSNDNVRLFRVNTDYSTERKTDILPTGWKPLTKENIYAIVDLAVAALNARLADKRLTLCLTDAARDLIIERAYDPIYGARPLKRYLQSAAETLIAKEILRGDLAAGSTLVLDAENGELSCRKK